MRNGAIPAGIGALPRGAVSRRLTRIRAFRRRHRLDIALAHGADPWSTGELMVRAAQLGSLAERRKVAATLVSLVELAECQRRALPNVPVRQLVVLEQRDALLALAARLNRPEPVDVTVAAQLELLLSDSSSPVYSGGRDPDGLAKVTSRCLSTFSEDLTSD
jgi:hypothetical protein